MFNDILLLIARFALVGLFFMSGYGMATAPVEIAQYFGSLGMPLPGIVVWLVVALKFVAGTAILVGFQTKYAAFALAGFSVAAAIMGHGFSTPDAQLQLMKDFAVAGGLLALTVSGPGKFSVHRSQ